MASTLSPGASATTLRKRCHSLLVTSFSPSEMGRHLAHHPNILLQRLVNDLPDPAFTPAADYFGDLLVLLEQRGLLDGDFFELMVSERPAKAAEIKSLSQQSATSRVEGVGELKAGSFTMRAGPLAVASILVAVLILLKSAQIRAVSADGPRVRGPDICAVSGGCISVNSTASKSQTPGVAAELVIDVPLVGLQGSSTTGTARSWRLKLLPKAPLEMLEVEFGPETRVGGPKQVDAASLLDGIRCKGVGETAVATVGAIPGGFELQVTTGDGPGPYAVECTLRSPRTCVTKSVPCAGSELVDQPAEFLAVWNESA